MIGPLAAAAFRARRAVPNPAVVAKSFAAALTDPFGGGSLYWRAPEWTTFRPAPKGGATPFVQRRSVQYFGPPATSVLGDVYAALPDAFSEGAALGPHWPRGVEPELLVALRRRLPARLGAHRRDRAAGGREGLARRPLRVRVRGGDDLDVDVNAAKATFGQGGEIIPHLFWRSGRVLDTVSGPFPAATLAAIARSLKPVGG